MIHNKFRYLLTLVALIAVTTGAWADETPLLTIESKDYKTFTSGSKTFDDKVTITFSSSVENEGDEAGWYAFQASLLTVAGTNGYTITSCKFYTYEGTAANGYTVEGESPSVYLTGGNVYTDASRSVFIGQPGIVKIEVYGAAASSASAVEVDWNKTSKQATFTMPAYDVELIPEYYPGMLTIGSGVIEGGKLEVVGLTDTTLPAGFEKDEEGNIYVEPGTVIKVKVVPNEGYRLVSLTDGTNDIEVDADGIATITMPDEYADLTLTATFSNEYTVALNAEGLSDEEAAAWKAATGDNDPAALPLENVKYGTEVKVTYSGTRKVIGVKAEKKAATPATPAESTVTWNSENISFLQLYEPSAPFTMMGIKLSTSSASNTADWRNIGIPTNDGLYFDVTTTGGYTFTAPSGKKFTKIEMTVTNANGWTQVLFQSTLGTGWPSGGDAVTVVEDTKKVTWTGTAASTVGLLTDASYFNASPVTSIVFTLADAE